MNIGQKILHYKILDKLGEGGMGVVYKARDRKLDRTVALKFLPPHLTKYKNDRKRFIREAKSAAALNHPNICGIHAIEEHEGKDFISMEYIDGVTLREKLRSGQITFDSALGYAAQIAEALGTAHEKGIIHRDIKPDNIMIDANNRMKVMDFGLAKMADSAPITKTGATVGTMAYMAPEQIEGKQIDNRADLFSLGVVLFEMLAGERPFKGQYDAALTYAIANEDPPLLSGLKPELPEALSNLVDRLLEKDPENRIDSATEVIDQLKDIRNSSSNISDEPQPEKTKTESIEESKENGSTTFSITIPNLGFEKRSIARSGLLTSMVGLLAIILLAGWWLMKDNTSEGSESTIPGNIDSEISNQTIAVLPFEVSGSGADEWRDGMVTTLSLNLDGAAGLRSIADRTIFAAWDKENATGNLGTDESLEISRKIGAEYSVLGSAVQLGEDLRFAADVHETATGNRLGQAEVRGSPDSVMTLADELTKEILGILLEKSSNSLPNIDLASITTESLPAFKKFIEGERHLRIGETEDGIRDFEDAIALDSTFALPYARIALLGLWRHEAQGQFIKRAYELSDQLPPRNRRLIQALYLGRYEHYTLEAADQFRQLTEDYPNDPSVWNSLGEFIFHANIPGGLLEVEKAHRHAVNLDPKNISYYDHYILTSFNFHHDSLLVAQRIEEMPESNWKSIFSININLAFGTPNQQNQALNRLDTLAIPEPWHAFGALLHPKDQNLETRVLGKLSNREDLNNYPYTIWFVRNTLRGGELKKMLTKSKKFGIEPGQNLAWFMSMGFPVPDSIAQQYLDPENLPANPTVDNLKYSAIYLINEGREKQANELIDRIAASTDSTENKSARMYEIEAIAQELRGYLALKTGDLQQAETLLNRSIESSIPGVVWRGDLYRELNELEKAEDWYLTAWIEPLAHERLGILYEQMDQPEKAAAAYRRFIKAWENADPELQHRVEQAQERLQHLEITEGSTARQSIDS